MASSLSSRMMRRVRHGIAAVALGATAGLTSGCTLMDSSTYTASSSPHSAAPTGEPREICTYFDKNLQAGPDPTRNYEMSPCLVGRLILFGADSKPVCCDGKVTVVLYDARPAGGGMPVALEKWDIDKANLKKMIAVDSLGMWGYTLALPTETCRPNLSQIKVDVQFQPEHGEHTAPLFAQSSAIRMSYDDLLQRNNGAILASRLPPRQPAMNQMQSASAQQPMPPQQVAQQPMPQQQVPQQQMSQEQITQMQQQIAQQQMALQQMQQQVARQQQIAQQTVVPASASFPAPPSSIPGRQDANIPRPSLQMPQLQPAP